MEIKTTQNNFPHSKNIKNIIQRTSILDVLGDIDFYFGGGFAVALMYAPREEENNLLLCKNYYSDIDLFFKDQQSLNKAIDLLNALRATNKLRKVCETENAITYEFYAFLEEAPFPEIYNLQLIKKYIGTPSQILSTFDILNSRILYSHKEDCWYTDANYFNYQSAKKISLTDSTPLLDVNNTEYPNSIFFQLERLSKYIQRYDLELDQKSLMKLIKIQRQIPDLSFEKNEKVIVRGYYSSYSKYVSSTFNVWLAFINIFKNNSNWNTIKKYMNGIDEEAICKMESSNENSMH
tara:strand:+ start:4459 stop:5337 length:879 start_codon:yes stop_codon:yes gene_type:complete